MKQQMLMILTEVSKGNKSPETAQSELLGLFGDSVSAITKNAKDWWAKECFKMEYKKLKGHSKSIINEKFTIMQFYSEWLNSR